jgi:hypothetical protein
VSSAIDASTGKIEIRISAENESLKPGDTVRITSSSTAGTTDDAAILLPLAAVKFEGDSSYVLVVKNDVLERLTVTVGDVVGDSITVTEGLTSTTEIVLDARGKAAGTKVVVKQK